MIEDQVQTNYIYSFMDGSRDYSHKNMIAEIRSTVGGTNSRMNVAKKTSE
jgi:hypothetical protein